MDNMLLQQGVDLMLFGMGTVFAFLTSLVIGTSIMSRVITRYLPEEIEAVPPVMPIPFAAGSADSRVLEVIQDAVYQHRAKHQK